MAVVSYKDTMKRTLKSPMRKTFTFLGVTLILVAVFLMGAIKPTLSTIQRIQSEIKTRESVDRQLQTKLNNIQTLQNVYRSKKTDLEVIDIYFPANTDYSLVLASLEKITARYGFSLNSLSISSENSALAGVVYPGMELVGINLNLSGRPADVTKLLKHLEGLPVVPDIVSVSFSPSEAEEENGLVGVSISMNVYKTINTAINIE